MGRRGRFSCQLTIRNPTLVSAVVAAVSVITNDPAAGTTFFRVAVLSLVRIVANTVEFAVHWLLVTVTVVWDAAKFTVPDALLIVWLPVVPPAVTV